MVHSWHSLFISTSFWLPRNVYLLINHYILRPGQELFESFLAGHVSDKLSLRVFFDLFPNISSESLDDSWGSFTYFLITFASMQVRKPSTSSIFMRSGSCTASHPPMGRPFDRRLKFQTTLIPQLHISVCCGVGYSPYKRQPVEQ